MLICSLTTFGNIIVGNAVPQHKMKLLSKSFNGGYSILLSSCRWGGEEKNNKYWECQKFEYQSRSMVLLIICIFFRAVVVENISFWRRRLLFKRLSSWVWKCLRVCFVPPPPTKKAIAKKNLEADNENFSVLWPHGTTLRCSQCECCIAEMP